jgi:hypothetical protein
MAECRVESLKDNNKSKDDNNVDIPEGKVQKGFYFSINPFILFIV